MQPHEQRDPDPRKPPSGQTTTSWLLFVIATLLGLITSQMVKRALCSWLVRAPPKRAGALLNAARVRRLAEIGGLAERIQAEDADVLAAFAARASA